MSVRDALLDALDSLALARAAGGRFAGALERTEALAGELPAGAWTRRMARAYEDLLDQPVVPPVGTCAFPTTDPRLEVAVRVTRRHARVTGRAPRHPPAVAAAVRAALGAARRMTGQADGLDVVFDPPPAATGGTLWDGPSCGLAVALAAASLLRSEPLLPTVWATGAVFPDGRLRPVGGMGVKAGLSQDRTLLVPEGSVGVSGDTLRCAALAEAFAYATGVHAPAMLARRVRAATAGWLSEHGAAWLGAREHDARLRDALQRSRRLGIVGRPGSGRTSALVRLVQDVVDSSDVLVLATEAPGDDRVEGLPRALRALLGVDVPWVPDALLAAARAVDARRVRICIDGVGPVVAAALGSWADAHVEVVWTRVEDGSTGRFERRLPALGLALRLEVLARSGVEVARAPPESRDVLEEPVAIEVRDALARVAGAGPATSSPRCRAHLWGLLGAELAAARPTAAAAWPVLGAGVLADGVALAAAPCAPWLAEAVAVLRREGLVHARGDGVHFARVDAERAAVALAASAWAPMRALPSAQELCARVRQSPGAAEVWGDEVEARLLADAPGQDWIAGLAACVEEAGARRPGAAFDPLGVVTVLGALARADLRTGRSDLVQVAEALRADRGALGECLATGVVLGWVFEAHALFARRLERATALVRAVGDALPPRAARRWHGRWRALRAWLLAEGRAVLPARRSAVGLPVYVLGAFPRLRWAPADAPAFHRFQQTFGSAVWRALRRRRQHAAACALAEEFVRASGPRANGAWRRRAAIGWRDAPQWMDHAVEAPVTFDLDALRREFLRLAGVLPPPTDEDAA
jgi:hypothetical protein